MSRFNGRISPVVACVLVTWVISGILLFVTSVVPGLPRIDPALANAGLPVEITISVLITVGSILVLLSGNYWKNYTTAWKLELVGLPLTIAGWYLHGFITLFYSPFMLMPIVLSIGYASAAIVRFKILTIEKLVVRNRVEHVHITPNQDTESRN